MPKFLEEKLKKEYGTSKKGEAKVFATMNAIGAMHGNKETEKGKQMERKHEAHVAHGRSEAPDGSHAGAHGKHESQHEGEHDRGHRARIQTKEREAAADGVAHKGFDGGHKSRY